MKNIAIIFSLLVLAGCGSDSKPAKRISDDSYVLQTIASDYGSSQVVVGNLNDNRQNNFSILSADKSDYTIDTYKDKLYHIGKFNIDTIDAYQSSFDLEQPVKSFSANFEESGSANTYKLLQISENVAYLIQYGRSDVLQLDLSASNSQDLVTQRIDLSAYNAGSATSPNASDAVISGDYLLVSLQRFDENYTANTAYVVAIDISDAENPIEIDTDTQNDGLFGIALEGINPISMSHYNGTVLIASRGDYASNSGALEKLSTIDFTRETLLDGTSLTEYNTIKEENSEYYHFSRVAINSNAKAYFSINVESGYNTLSTHLLEIDLLDNATNEVQLSSLQNINTLAFSPNDRLWIGSSNESNPGVFVMDTDTNTQNQSYITTELPVHDIEFLEIDVNQ